MLALSDEELDVLFNLSAPIEPAMRDAFLRAVALELELERYKPEQLGVGLITRVCRPLQKEFVRAPVARGPAFMSKYR
jgi:hypothetical protein